MQRFKGLGEMNPSTLKETTLDPRKRRLLQVCIAEGQLLPTEQMIADLMGKDPAPRLREIVARLGATDSWQARDQVRQEYAWPAVSRNYLAPLLASPPS